MADFSGGRKSPVGTQSYWGSTGQTMIKTHDNTIFDDIVPAWIALPTTEENWLIRFKQLDRTASYILTYKEPVDGELWLDKEISEFTTKTGKTFSPSELKQYSNYASSKASYSFTEELTKRREWNRIRLQSLTAETLVEANKRKKYKLAESGEGFDDSVKMFLTKEEIKEIREEVKSKYVQDSSQHITREDVDEIQALLGTILGYLEKGETFDGEQAQVYQEGKDLLNRLTSGEYAPLSEIRVLTREYLLKMDKVFKDAWGVRESYRKKLDSSFNKYVSRFRGKIEEEELEVFKSVVGVDLYAPTEEFYGAIAKSKIFQEVNLEDYVGRMVPHPDNKYKDVLFERYEDGQMFFIDETATTKVDTSYPNNDNFVGKEQSIYVSQDTLQSIISQREVGSELEIPLKLRFTKLYGKDIQGDFNRGDLTLLRTFEKIATYLPPGHLLTNPELKKLRKQTYFQDGDNSYAHYQGGKREIYISNQAARSNQLGIVDLNKGEELASVLVHEIGHSLSERLGRRDSGAYKRFVVECGWTWEQFKLGNRNTNYQATGNDEDIKRFGSKSGVPLITEYAGKSPEEAFAEYYSFYSQYKKHIDKFLSTGDKRHLEKDTTVKLDLSPKSFRDHPIFNHISSNSSPRIDAILSEKKRDLSNHIKVTVIDPYLDNLEVTKEKHVPTGKIVYQKSDSSRNKEVPTPVFSVFDSFSGKQDIIDEGEHKDSSIHFANKYLRRVSPTFSISKECYKLLTDSGFTHKEIRDYTLGVVGDRKIPVVKEIDKGEKKGLRYRSTFVDANHLEKMSGIFGSMKGMWESEELQKALKEMGLLETIETDLLEKSKETTILGLLAPYKEGIKKLLGIKKKQVYGDMVVRNFKGEILILQRSSQDDFQPGVWSLPGGKVEPGETPLQGAIRELEEETGIRVEEVTELGLKKRTDSVSHYFETWIFEPKLTFLDNEEHYRYQWIKIEDLKDYDLILDLGQTLSELPLGPVPTYELEVTSSPLDIIEKRKKELEEGFDLGIITVEDYLVEKGEINQELFSIVEEGFNEGKVSTENYLKYKNIVEI